MIQQHSAKHELKKANSVVSEEELKNHGSYVLRAWKQKLREEEVKHPEALKELKVDLEQEESMHRMRSMKSSSSINADDHVSSQVSYARGSLIDKIQSRYSPVQIDGLQQELRKEESMRRCNSIQNRQLLRNSSQESNTEEQPHALAHHLL